MRFATVCSGIEAASLAWEPLGWGGRWFSEIDPFRSALLEQRFPKTPNLGDMAEIDPTEHGPIDLFLGGTPCQSFSVAGWRAGLADDRGNLALQFVRLVAESLPRWIVWENVPGVLSTNGGRDFGALLGGLAECGYGFAYRVLDAQGFGVPQRRRRVFLVGHSGGRWERAAAVLFERESLRRGREKGRSPRAVDPSPAEGGSAFCLNAKGGTGRHDASGETLIPVGGFNWQNGGGYGDAEPGWGFDEELSPPVLRKQHPAVAFSPAQITSIHNRANPQLGDPAPTLTRTSDPTAVAIKGDRCWGVRRLTPVECERLQGMPDNWTQINWLDKGPDRCPDGLRYKAIGDSIAVPVLRWIGERIAAVESVIQSNSSDG